MSAKAPAASGKSAYAKVAGGALSVKGGLFKKKKKSKKRKREGRDRDDERDGGADGADGADGASASASASASSAAAAPEDELTVVGGLGRITSSGTTVSGHGTKFQAQLRSGDALIISHPTTFAEETRIVKMVLSDLSVAISSPFSTDLITTTPYSFVSAPRAAADTAAVKRASAAKANAEEKVAFGTYAGDGGTKFTYRQRRKGAFGGYDIVTEDTGREMSREELLDMRSKKKADRMCM